MTGSHHTKEFFAYRGIVHPWLCDAMGHLTTRNYQAMFDDAGYHLYHAVFGYAPGLVEWKDMGWVDVKQEILYKSELRVGELVVVKATLQRIGSKSISYACSMRRVLDDSEAALLMGTAAFFDMKERRATPLTAVMRDRAQQWLIDRSGSCSDPVT